MRRHGAEFGRCAASCRAPPARGRRRGGDRVVIVSENRPEYAIAETALMAMRAVPVPTYITNTVEDHAHILRDSGARAAIVSTPALAGALSEAGRQAGGLDLLVVMDEAYGDSAESPRLAHWRSLVGDVRIARRRRARGGLDRRRGACLPDLHLRHRRSAEGRDAAAPLDPVELPRRLRAAAAAAAWRTRVYLSFLPLSHSYEHTVGQFFLPSIGTEIVYCARRRAPRSRSADRAPHHLTAVPRVLEVIRGARPHPGRAAAGLASRRLFRARARTRHEACRRTAPRSGRTAARPGARPAGARQGAGRFGGRLKAAMSGGARLEPEVGRFFLALGLTLMQGYGQTEAAR